MRRQLGRMPDELLGPPCPEALEHVWAWFVELERGRSCTFGPGPIAWSELDAWQRVSGNRPSAFELGCLIALDRAYLQEIS